MNQTLSSPEHVILLPANEVLPSLEDAVSFSIEHPDYFWLEGDSAYRTGQKSAFIDEEIKPKGISII